MEKLATDLSLEKANLVGHRKSRVKGKAICGKDILMYNRNVGYLLNVYYVLNTILTILSILISLSQQ